MVSICRLNYLLSLKYSFCVLCAHAAVCNDMKHVYPSTLELRSITRGCKGMRSHLRSPAASAYLCSEPVLSSTHLSGSKWPRLTQFIIFHGPKLVSHCLERRIIQQISLCDAESKKNSSPHPIRLRQQLPVIICYQLLKSSVLDLHQS